MWLDGVRLGMCFGLLCAVVVVCWLLLRDRRGAVPIVVGCAIGYLVLGNLLSRVMLLDVILPANGGESDASVEHVRQVLFVHTLVSMGAAAAATVAVARGLGRVLQRAVDAA